MAHPLKVFLYHHTVTIKIGDITIDNEELDCEFDIPFDDDTEADEAEIIVYNISNTNSISKAKALRVE